MPDFLLVLLLALSCAIQLIFIFFVFLPLGRRHDRTNDPQHTTFPSVSIVICARNEHFCLKNNLEAVLNQDYPNFEVLVVDDHSDDDTAALIQSLNASYPQLKLIPYNVQPKSHKGKKEALEEGVKAAKNELLLLTDADCRPASSRWIECMVKALSSEKDFVLGYSPVKPQKGILNMLVRFDVWMIAMQYLGLSSAGLPYMGTGRNLLYRKSVRNQKVNPHLDLISGDDDLFVNQLATAKNTATCILPQAHVFTWAPQTVGHYFRQKRRHLTTGIRYRIIHKVILSLYTFSKLILYLLSVLIFVFDIGRIYAFYYLLTYWIAFVFVAWKWRHYLRSNGMLLLIPILDGVSVFFNSFVFASTIFGNTTRWK